MSRPRGEQLLRSHQSEARWTWTQSHPEHNRSVGKPLRLANHNEFESMVANA
ncbi:hypothetical protein GS597_03910 [Synechococcales cyanobacterium C]|uniref:Uncharacterized protein n=1 Tax=Petrachloros mirabilis ULC683 TaxID=2781853 RepID=A0A8K1ZX17_9CYAN|nr:hypothetical protein [Petrachloros mirabilis ULC683]